MLPHCKSDIQFELFEAPAPAAQPTPRLALPFQRSQEIDLGRAASILGSNPFTVRRMVLAKLFRAYQLPGSKQYRIEYNSVVDYCNQLRLHYRISEDRLLRKPLRGRLRDEDLLPFPMAATIGVAEVRAALDCTHTTVLHLLEEGALVGYQLFIDLRGCPWRIYAPSLERYLQDLRIASAPVAPSHDRSA
jgi:hypothetical protein